MTSSLPDFSSSPASAPANDAASLAALFPAASPEAGSASGPAREFDDLMGDNARPSGPTAPTRPQGCASSTDGKPVEQPLFAFGAKVALSVSTVELASSVAPVAEPTLAGSPREITRDMLEEAAAFAASLLQAALPGVQLPELLALANQPAPATTGSAGGPASAAAQGGKPATEAGASPLFTLAADGAIELKLDLAQLKPVEFNPAATPDQAVTINAELQRPGEITVRLEASSGLGAGEASSADATGRAIFAAKYPGLKISATSAGKSGERNFVFAGDKQVKPTAAVGGIAVAKPESTMPVAPIVEFHAPRTTEGFSGMPQRVEFQAIMAPAERSDVPATESVQQNFAARAVDTVTGLAETQFSASMQKSGSVQLRLRFGGEDLNVRVEIRDGAVHTDFRTDSPELRSALSREWQSLAAQAPEQMRRFLEPVFSPAPAAAETPSPFARSHQQAQQDLPSRTPRDTGADSSLSFSRRSQLSDSFIPEPAAARGPAFLPTSLRLSVLA